MPLFQKVHKVRSMSYDWEILIHLVFTVRSPFSYLKVCSIIVVHLRIHLRIKLSRLVYHYRFMFILTET